MTAPCPKRFARETRTCNPLKKHDFSKKNRTPEVDAWPNVNA